MTASQATGPCMQPTWVFHLHVDRHDDAVALAGEGGEEREEGGGVFAERHRFCANRLYDIEGEGCMMVRDTTVTASAVLRRGDGRVTRRILHLSSSANPVLWRRRFMDEFWYASVSNALVWCFGGLQR